MPCLGCCSRVLTRCGASRSSRAGNRSASPSRAQSTIASITARTTSAAVYGVVTTGAESDLRQVTSIARQMVVRYGMSPKVGVLSLTDDPDNPGASASFTRPYSEETAALIDEEVRRISEECLAQAVTLLTGNRDKLDALVKALLVHDTLGETEILEVTGLQPLETSAAVAD
jgi:cell division protease FtsH